MPLRHVLVPTDGSACAERAFVPAAALAVPAGATVTVVRVLADPDAPDTGRVARIDGPHVGDEAFDLVPVAEIEVEAGDVVAALLEQVARVGPDLVVMGTHGRSGVSRLRLGSVAEAVARRARCPVLLVRDGAAVAGWAVRRVLAAVDPSDLDADRVPASTAWAAALAAWGGARLDLLSVATGAPSGPYRSVRRCAAGLLALSVRVAGTGEAPSHVDYVVRQGDAAECVVAEAERTGADLVVMGSRARRGVRRWALGSAAEAVARTAPCPVLLVPPTARRPSLVALAESRQETSAKNGQASLAPVS